MKKITKVQRNIDLAFTIGIMLMIFCFSAQDGTQSSSLSDGIAYQVIDSLRRLIPGLSMEMTTFLIRKAAHFSEYTLLGLFMSRTIRDCVACKRRDDVTEQVGISSGEITLWKCRRAQAVIAWIMGTVYAATDEFHQLFVPGRAGQVRDVCIDSAGVFFGVLLLYGTIWIHSERQAKSETL